MAIGVQVTIDAVDPHRLVRFWAAALGYEIEEHPDLVQGLLDAGSIGADDVVEVDGLPRFRDLVACSDVEGARPRLLFQRTDAPKTGKNRVHLDLHVDDVDAEAARLEGLGARRLWERHDRGGRCVTLADPEGNELCVEAG